MIIIAHNIRSLHNVGSIFRNSAAFGIETLYLTGITGTPPRKEIAKTALGAEDLVEWKTGDIAEIIRELKEDGVAVYGLEQDDAAVMLDEFSTGLALSSSSMSERGEQSIAPKPRLALVLGNEVEGIDAQTRVLLDGYIEIPMKKKKSLNVSVASGIAMYVLTKEEI